MRGVKSAFLWLMLAALLTLAPLAAAHAETAMDTNLVLNGGAELAATTYWSPENPEEGRWSTSELYSTWPPPAVGSRYFFIYNAGLGYDLVRYMEQNISLSGTEGSGLFASISAGTVSLRLNLYMYQAIASGSDVKAVVEQYSASNALLKSSQVVNTTVGTGAMARYELNTGLDPAARSLKVRLQVTLANSCYA